MITAIVHVDVEVSLVPEAAAAIADVDGVSEVYSVTGDTDLVVMVRVAQQEALADVIADRIGKVHGVRATRTYLAFRAYSRHDLEAAFAIGADE
ncbi:Lrp/AsnC family transcriptional regulator [Quadrisphaera setariae]|uniref:Lrp/AsnC family transcriptional regulator n=1 Tax=Quadrisphaera setariae TaxID=2593304 RepID=A0A5C8Z661_9ACTN|nr:Lrp/AsnC ligand binding domain-containing protein [Quadrisphaera setariae]TXR52763.1 Lrp/AsnC family transcriptional regulator [Quadrisphaera setariae]